MGKHADKFRRGAEAAVLAAAVAVPGGVPAADADSEAMTARNQFFENTCQAEILPAVGGGKKHYTLNIQCDGNGISLERLAATLAVAAENMHMQLAKSISVTFNTGQDIAHRVTLDPNRILELQQEFNTMFAASEGPFRPNRFDIRIEDSRMLIPPPSLDSLRGCPQKFPYRSGWLETSRRIKSVKVQQ